MFHRLSRLGLGFLFVVLSCALHAQTGSVDPERATPVNEGGGSMPPVISSFSPFDVSSILGASATFSPSINSGSPPFTFQWVKNGVVIPGATGGLLQLVNLTSADAGKYSCIVTNIAGSATSREATLTVSPPTPIVFISQPQSQTLFSGQTLSLSVSPTGSPPIAFQWRRNGTAIAGATDGFFSIGSLVPADSGSYSVVATNPAGSVISTTAVITVSPPVAPTIVRQPEDRNVDYGSSFSISVAVGGSPPFAFDWKKDGIAVSGGDTAGSTPSSNYVFNAATPARNGVYTVTVTNAAGSVTSRDAIIVVAAATPPKITSQPSARQVTVGLGTAFYVGYSGTSDRPFTFQWSKNGVPIVGATSDGYVIDAVRDNDAGSYSVVISGSGGSVTSASARLTVVPAVPPSVKFWPLDTAATLGQMVNFGVNDIRGSPPLAIQWYKDGLLIAEATGAHLNFQKVAETDLGIYTSVISNSAGVIASPPISLSAPRPSPWIAATQFDNAVYFLAASPSRIERYDLTADRWLPTVILGGTQAPTAFLPVAEGVYVAYGRTLVRRSSDLSKETSVADSASDITVLYALDDFLYFNTILPAVNGTAPVLKSIRRSNLAPGPDNELLSRQPALAPRTRRVFGSEDRYNGVSPRIATIGLDGRHTAADLTKVAYSNFPSSSRLYVFPSEEYLANGAGSLFHTSDFSYAGSIGVDLNDLTFLGDGTPVVLRDRVLRLLGAPGFLESRHADLPFVGVRAFATASGVVVFGSQAASGDAFRVAKVPLASFLPASGAASSVTPTDRFSVDGVFEGADGVVGIFSRSRQALLRWSSATQGYLPSIPLRGQPTFVTQTPSSTRILLLYGDGTLTEVPLRTAFTPEHIIATVGSRLIAVTDLNDMVLLDLHNYADSGVFRFVIGAQVQTLPNPNWGGTFNAGAAWLPASRRLFTYSAGGIGSLKFETIPASGELPGRYDPTAGPTVNAPAPLRFNSEGTLFAAGNGRVFTTNLAPAGVLGYDFLDAAWLANCLLTLSAATDGGIEIQRWDRLNYLRSGTLTLPGIPQRILRVSETQALVVSLIQGFLSYTLVNFDLSLATPLGVPSRGGVYSGAFGPAGADGVFSLYIRPDRTGVFLIQFAHSADALLSTDVVLGTDGLFVTTAHALDGSTSRVTAGIISSAGGFTGTIPSLNLSFNGTKAAGTAASAGFYSASALNGNTGEAYVIVGEDGRALFVARASSKSDGGTASVGNDGKFNLITPAGTKISGMLNVAAGDLVATTDSGALSGSAFAGLRDNVIRTDRLANISTRGRAGPGDDVMIAGFVLTGTAPRPVLVRAIGPTLGGFGVPGTLADPRLELYRGSTKLSENDNWSSANDLVATTARLGGFALAAGSADAALLLTLDPGAYSAQVSGPGGSVGNALVEVYDAGTTPSPGTAAPRLVNIATRGRLASADDTLIAGIVITGNAPKRLLVRAIGPGLAAFGVTGTLVDPVLTLTGPTASGPGTLAANDDWASPATGGPTAAEIAAASVATGAFALPNGSKDACLLLTLAPGNYTAQVTGKNNGTGVALIEVYEVNN
ncbi:MAG: immunoglobulin domain-containing protein [Verrucomicrobia bacterium]|nr:immunoglobulin domain-containing protein [Verrucomicrobiota bacterium]